MVRRALSVSVALAVVLAARRRPWSWLLPVLTAAAAAGGLAGGLFAGRSHGGAFWGLLALALTGVTLTAALPYGREWARRAEQEAGELRVALRNALQPLAESVATLPRLLPSQRPAELATVGAYAVAALTLVMDDVPGLRAVAYQVDESGEAMTVLAYHGRGGPAPQEFRAGTARGDSAIDLVRRSGTLVVDDLRAGAPAAYAGSMSGYATFISVAIHDGTYAYGMLTVDAPVPGTLAALDVHLLEVVADLLSIAFAIARATW